MRTEAGDGRARRALLLAFALGCGAAGAPPLRAQQLADVQREADAALARADARTLAGTRRRASRDPYLALIRASESAAGRVPGSTMRRPEPRALDPVAQAGLAAGSSEAVPGCRTVPLPARHGRHRGGEWDAGAFGSRLADAMLPGSTALRQLPGLAMPTLDMLEGEAGACRRGAAAP